MVGFKEIKKFSIIDKINILMNKLLIIIFTFLLSLNSLRAENFTSIENFSFELPDGYELFNNSNLFETYNHTYKDPIIKKQIKLAKEYLEKQKIELLYNFSSHALNNINILVFNEKYKVNSNSVRKFCKKILKLEKKVGQRKVKLTECRMHNKPFFADWAMYRENESSFVKGATTQQIIFLYKRKEYVITSTCWQKCNETRNDLFNLVKSIKF